LVRATAITAIVLLASTGCGPHPTKGSLRVVFQDSGNSTAAVVISTADHETIRVTLAAHASQEFELPLNVKSRIMLGGCGTDWTPTSADSVMTLTLETVQPSTDTITCTVD
jgi:hypothetical protein